MDNDLYCPKHGLVDGLFQMEGPLSNCYPYPLVCEECMPEYEVIVGWEGPNEEIKRRWEDLEDEE